jgi:hypothetical protein
MRPWCRRRYGAGVADAENAGAGLAASVPRRPVRRAALKGLDFCCDYRMSATQRVRKSGNVAILWHRQTCRSWLRDDRLMELVVGVVCSELLDPLRVALCSSGSCALPSGADRRQA